MNWQKHRRIIFYLLPLLTMLAVAVGCDENGRRPVPSYANRIETDKFLEGISDTTRLHWMLLKYQNGGNITYEVAILERLGTLARERNAFTEAIRYHNEALVLSQRTEDTISIIQNLNSIGTNFRRMGLTDEAEDYHTKALAMSMKYSDRSSLTARKTRLIALTGLGNAYRMAGKLMAADSVLRISLNGEKRLKSPLGQAINYASIGSVKEDLGQTDSAWIYFGKSLECNTMAKSRVGVALNHMSFGNLYEKQGLEEQAIKEYKTSYDVLNGTSERWHWLDACISLARLYHKTGRDAEGSSYLRQASTVASQIHSKEHLQATHELLNAYYESRGDYKSALEELRLAQLYKDSVENEANHNRIESLYMAVGRSEQQMEADMATTTYKAQKRARKAFNIEIIAIFVFVVVAVVMVWLFIRSRRQKAKLTADIAKIRERFFANITHEFTTPLNIIIGEGERLADSHEASLEKEHNAGGVIGRQGSQMLSLVNLLLDIGKAKSDIGEAEWHTGNVIPFINTILEDNRYLAGQKNVSMLFKPAEDSVCMDLVPDYMTRIVQNLISNAVKFTPAYGNILISTRRAGDFIHLKVADNGIGMDNEVLKHVFEPFFQAASDTQNIGTGLGLSLVKRLVEAMNGEITVSSEPGKGSTFTVKLPLHHGAGNWSPLPQEPSAVPSTYAPIEEEGDFASDEMPSTDEPTTLLVVSDNAEEARYIGSLMPKGYAVIYANSGESGLKKALSSLPSMIIVDLIKPGMDALELCRRLREQQSTDAIPVIVISDKFMQADLEEGLEAGVNAFVFKPFSAKELLLHVRGLLKERFDLTGNAFVAIQKPSRAQQGITSGDVDFISRLTGIIYEQLRKGDIDLEAAASKMSMSQRALRWKMSEVTGSTPAGYVMKIRLDYAQQLLKLRPDLSINDIAIRCGFRDQSYFSKIFKSYNGVTPIQFRKGVLAEG